MSKQKIPCNECRNARSLTWLGMCVTCTLVEVERRLAANKENPRG